MRRARLLLPCLIAMTGMLAACTKSAPPTRQAPVPEPEAVITIHIGLQEKDSLRMAFDALTKEFQEKHEQYRVQLDNLPPLDNLELVRQEVRSGKYDLLGIYGSPDYLTDAGLLEPLDPYLTKSSFDVKPLGSLLERMQVKGRNYVLPVAGSPLSFVANLDLFDAVQVPLPKDGWTWNEFRALAAQLTRGTDDEKIWGFGHEAMEDLVKIWVEEKAGGPLWTAKPEHAAEALGFFATMTLTDTSAPKPQVRWRTDEWKAENRPYFSKGKAAMGLERFPYRGGGTAPGFRWDVLPTPVVPDHRPVALVSPDTFGMAASSAHLDAAWEFLRFASGPEGAAIVARSGFVPLYGTEEVKAAWMSRTPAPPAATAQLFRSDWTMDWWGTAEIDSATHVALYKAANLALTGDATVEAAMEKTGWNTLSFLPKPVKKK